jgi:CPA2 family monovalent cation:H+ antiporter-2
MVARGEFSIAIASLAVAAGVDGELEALTATYVLILAILGPALVRSTRLLGRPAQDGAQPPAPADARMLPEAEA